MASSSRSESSPETGECTVNDSDTNEECSCTEFGKLKSTGLCNNCFHERKYHLKSSGKAAQRVQTILSGMLQGSSSSTLGKIGRARGKLASSAAGSSGSRSKAANNESNQGLRPSKGKGKATTKQASTSSNMFRVVSVLVITCGTKWIRGKLELPEGHQGVPSKLEIQAAEAHGHAVVQVDEGIEFDRTCDHDEFTEALRVVLPHPFAYFENLEQESDDNEPSWYLAAVDKKRLGIVYKARPKGSDADYHKGSSTSSFRHSRLFIVSRKPIPREVIESWAEPDAIAKFQNPAGEVSESNASESENEDASPSPERARRHSKRRSDTHGDHDLSRKKQRKSASSSGKDTPVPEDEPSEMPFDGSYIDLTEPWADNSLPPWSTGASGDSTSSFHRPATPPQKPNPVDPAFSNEFKLDPTLGDPYATQTFDF